MISMQELNPNNYETSEEVQANLDHLLEQMNQVRIVYGMPMTINSGLRNDVDQQRINPSAPQSKHLIGCACDVNDPDGSLWAWVLQNMATMENLGIFFEDPRWTHHPDKHGWVHFQIVPPASGKRVFIPSPTSAMAPDFWDGVLLQ